MINGEDKTLDRPRTRIMTTKGRDNFMDMKRREIRIRMHKLNHFIQNYESGASSNTTNIEQTTSSLAALIEEFKQITAQSEELEQSNVELVETIDLLLLKSSGILNEIKNSKTDKSSVASRHTYHSSSRSTRTSRTNSSSSSSKLRALAAAEAAAAKRNAEYERLIADAKCEQKQREAEHERTIAKLTADKNFAVANAKLDAINQIVLDENVENDERGDNDLHELDGEIDKRTEEWVVENQNIASVVGGPDDCQPREGPPAMTFRTPINDVTNYARNRPPLESTPISNVTGSILEALTLTNQKIVAGIAKQNLPKCHPDTFNGDATLFHPWKRAFHAMLSEIEVTPEQEINYLREFTAGEVQRVVDNYRKRQYMNPSKLLGNLWAELERRFGSPAVITNLLLERLRDAASFEERNRKKLQEFADICADVDSQIDSLPGLACLNFPIAIRPIAQRMPGSLKAKWEKEVANYAQNNNDAYPPFSRLADIVKKQTLLKNHPNIVTTPVEKPAFNNRKQEPQRRALATKFASSKVNSGKASSEKSAKSHCLFHNKDGHTLSECKAFKAMNLQEKTEWVKKSGLCFLCFSSEHNAKDCTASISCDLCGDKRHNALLHKDKPNELTGKPTTDSSNTHNINTKCTLACDNNGGLSCSKIVLVDVYKRSNPNDTRRVYAIIDDQSNASLVSSELLDDMDVNGPQERYYLSTCSSSSEVKYGRKISDVVVRSVMEKKEYCLPQLTECDAIPRDKREIPTPQMVKKFPHLEAIADEIPELNTNANIHLLLGRDSPELLKVRAFKNGPRGAPWAQKLLLGWTVSGQTCLDYDNNSVHIQARKTKLKEPSGDSRDAEDLWPHGEECEVLPCHNQLKVTTDIPKKIANSLQHDIFHIQPDDNEASLSINDRKFIDIMQKGLTKNELGNWEMPLPFCHKDATLPNNRPQAVQRLNSLNKTLNRKPEMKKHYLEFMEKVISKGHASQIPPDEVNVSDGQVWYLPHFGVYHPKKPNQIRVVFDSSAEYEGTSLNKELLSGPDLANNLTGVLFRFRRNGVAVMCDIEQMFHSFHVSAEHRNYLRFLWFEDNDPGKGICEYRMNVHLFGNGPSPAVATYGLRATTASDDVDDKVKEFICRNFYVDDGLLSAPTTEEAIELVKLSQKVLATANLRLHKVVSNSREVMQAFPVGDRAKDLHDLDLTKDGLPAQRSLGVYWDLEKDSFTFRLSGGKKPFTRRGVLSTINSVYDPLGIAAPIVINGKRLLQQLMVAKRTETEHLGWDDPLPERQMSQWQRWKDDLRALESVAVPRCYQPEEFGKTRRAELHVFSDASQDAVAAAVYLRVFNEQNDVSVTLVYGQAKVAPMRPTSIPRLELCAAVMATQAAAKVQKELDTVIADTYFYTDSKVVLGYIKNEYKRFYVYVANRVQIIRSLSSPSQWRYIESERNPADLGTRGISASILQSSTWITGPDFLTRKEEIAPSTNIEVADDDPEIRKQVTAMKTAHRTKEQSLGTERFKRFSSFISLTRGIALILAWIRNFKARRAATVTSLKGTLHPSPQDIKAATILILKETQMDGGLKGQACNQTSSIEHKTDVSSLSPFIDANGLVRVGGRLSRSSLSTEEKHPVILPKGHYVSSLIVRHFHARVHHQGRQLTHAAIRQGGYWVVGGHRLVSSVIHQCVICRKSRGTHLCQRMADLPSDRLEEVPPFTNVGFDVFGPWSIVTRRTRGGAANSKRWGLLFTCLNSRAIHIEVLESMDSSSFICALRRFFSLRGPAMLLRSDRGSNFIGGKSELQPSDENEIQEFVTQSGCEWKFNPPHASHFGGVWERQIGTVRRVLDAMFAELGYQQLTHELLTTLMSEVTGIVNSRPLAAIPTDPDNPQPLSPQTILTMKTRPLGPPTGEFLPADLYARRRWRRTQYLAEQFWVRWRKEYLQNLQTRNKWRSPKRNLAEGDIVLIKDGGEHRNNWPMGRVSEAPKSDDGLVRKAAITTTRGGKIKKMCRPIKELVLLLPVEEQH